MRTRTITVSDDYFPTINLGRQGENAVSQVVFDVSSLITDYGAGTGTVVVQRPGEIFTYQHDDTVQSGSTVTWTISSADTELAGTGQVQLFWIVNNAIAKTITYQTYTEPALMNPTDAPVSDGGWISEEIGDLDDLNTTEKSNLVGAINEVDADVSDLKEDLNSLTLDIDDEDGLLYLYVNGVKQGEGIDVGGGATRYTITYNLANHIVSSNNRTKVNENSAYTTIISSNDPHYNVDDVTVTMGGTNITATAWDGEHTISIASVTGDVSITITAVYYPAVLLSVQSVTIKSGATTQVGVKLDGEPTQSQTVTLIPSSNLAVNTNTLTFTPSNYDTYQYVTITGGDVDEETYTQVTVRNSDPLMTDSAVLVILQAIEYSDVVDMTIPSGQVTAELSDFTYTDYGSYIMLTKYNGSATNLKVSSSMAEKTLRFTNACFNGNTDIEYLEIDPDISPWSDNGNFGGMTSLVGLKYRRALVGLKDEFRGDYNFEWWDGFELCTNATSFEYMLYCSSTPNTKLRYLPDLSGFTKLTNMSSAFWGCTALEKIFGMPLAYDSSCNMNNAFYGCTSLKKAVVGENVTSASSTFRYGSAQIGALESVDVYADNLTSSNSAGMFTSNNSKAHVRAHSNTSTYELLQTFVSSGNITLSDFSGATVPVIVTWGDSTTSEGTSWGCWPDRLQTKLGLANFAVRNEAVSGEFTTSTSARQGGNTLKNYESFVIPASGDVNLDPTKFGTRDGRHWGQNSDGGTFRPLESFNPCSISGVSGVLTNNPWNFARLASGDATTVSADTYIYSDQDDELNNSNVIMLVNLGINSGWEALGSVSLLAPPVASCLLTQVQYMVDHFLAKGGTKYIICGPSAGKYLENDAYKEIVFDYEDLAEEAFGTHWLNLREYGITYGLSQNNLTPTAEDTERMTAGKWPSSLLHGNGQDDLTHPNSYGANTQMLAFYEKGVALGYWT